MAKYAAAEAAIAAVDAAIQTHGGNGMSTEYGLVPLWGLARLLRIAPVSRGDGAQLRRPALPRPAPVLLKPWHPLPPWSATSGAARPAG